MNKKYIAPTIKVVIIEQEEILAGSIRAGEGEGTHDANAKIMYYDDWD